MVIVIKQNQGELCAQISKLESACNNRKDHPTALLWVEIPFHGIMVVETKGWHDLVAFQPWGRQSIAALLCNVCQLLAQEICHLQEAQISHSTRAATSSCLPWIDLHRGVTQKLQAGFLSFLGVTRFSLYLCLMFCVFQTLAFFSSAFTILSISVEVLPGIFIPNL